jgi:opine dehydrogenase
VSARIAILGAGAGGSAAAVEFSQRGYDVRMWSANPATVGGFRDLGGIGFDGVLGAGIVEDTLITTDLSATLTGADAALVCLPALAHDSVGAALATCETALPPIILHPGHTGGALHLQAILNAAGASVPPIAELSTLAYVARKSGPGNVTVRGVARHLWAACLPGGEEALAIARELYPQTEPARDVLATGLANPNLILHPPGAVLSAAWIEARSGDFRFYVDGMTEGVVRVMSRLDEERLQVAAGFGHELPTLAAEMAAIGTAEPLAAARGDLRGAITGGVSNSHIRAPDSLQHRYFKEDFACGLVPFLTLAEIAEVEVPVAQTLANLADALLGGAVYEQGLGRAALGLTGVDRVGLAMLVNGEQVAR